MLFPLIVAALVTVPATTQDLNGVWSGRISYQASFSTCGVEACTLERNVTFFFKDGQLAWGQDMQLMQESRPGQFFMELAQTVHSDYCIFNYQTRYGFTPFRNNLLVSIVMGETHRCSQTGVSTGCVCAYAGTLDHSKR